MISRHRAFYPGPGRLIGPALLLCISSAGLALNPSQGCLSIFDIDTINLQINNGYRHFEAGQADSALCCFDLLIAFDSSLANGYFQKARIYAALGNDSAAITCLEQAVARNMCMTSYADITHRDTIFTMTRNHERWPEVLSAIDAKSARLDVQARAHDQARKEIYLELVRIECSRDAPERAFAYLDLACQSGFADPAALSYSADCRDHIDGLLDHMQQIMLGLYVWNGSTEQKIWGLMLVHAAVKYNCANLDLADFADWDAEVYEYIPQVINARSMHEYYQVLQKLVSGINDDHTYIELPSCLNQDLDRPGISLVGIQDRFFVKRVFDRTLEEKGILAGMELIKIDDLPVADFASKNIYPYMPRLPHHSATWDCARKLLVGRKGSSMTLTLRDTLGNEKNVKVARNAQQEVDIEYHPLIEKEVLPGGIVYLNIRMFYGDAARIFADTIAALDLNRVAGMIIDLRDNPGGYTEIGDTITSHLITEPVVNYADTYSPVHIPLIKALYPQVSFNMHGQERVILPSRKTRYGGPLVLLTSPLTCSAAENFIMPFKNTGRALIIGMPTSGGTGNSVLVHLPGQGYMRVCISTNPSFVGKGIPPDRAVYPTACDLSRNADPVLDKALDVLRHENITKNNAP